MAAGCQSSYDREPLAEWIRRDPGGWRQSANAWPDTPGGLPSTMAVASGEDVIGDASVANFIRLALARNPDLQAAAYRVDRMAARVSQATSLDDPMLMVAPVGEMAQTAAGQVGLMTGVSQKLPLPQKLSTRGNIARADVTVARSEYEQTRLRVIADTRQAYWSYYYALRAIEQTGQSRELLNSLTQIAQSKFRAGTANQADVLRSMTELSELDNRLLTLAQDRDTAAARLNSLIDRPVDAEMPSLPAVEPQQLTLRLDTFLAAAGRANPELRGVLAQVDQDRQRLRLARLNYWPDLTVSANYNFVDRDGLAVMANGDDQYWLGFEINLPIWRDRLRAAEREAFRGMQEHVSRLAASQNRLAFQVREAYAAVDTQQRLVALFRDVIVPQARQTVDASAAGYQSGSVDFLAYLDAWRKLLDYQLMRERSVALMEQQLAELERLVGEPIATPTTQPTDLEILP